jgi:acetolactate synthase-1/2/3 large subunit
MIRVADYFVRYLADRQVDTAFLVSGGMMMHLMDAVAREPRIAYFCNFHEQASAMAADAYARVTGRAGLCLATGGPGGTNLLTGLVGAWQDSIPIVFLTGQSKLCDTVRGNNIAGLRQYGMFEVDLIPIVQSVTKYAAFVDRACDARIHMEKAFHLATTGRPGPVLLDVPLDIQGALIDPDRLPRFDEQKELAEQAQPLLLSDQRVERILTQLRAAKKPLLWAGHGVRCSASVESFRVLVERLGIPVLTTHLAKDLLPYEHPLFVGHPGIKGNRAANLALNETDLLLVIGSSLHGQNIGWEPELFVPGACKIHVDPDPAILQKTKAIVTEQIQADVGVFVAAMSCLLDSHCHETGRYRLWREQCQTLKTQHAPMSEGHQLGPADGPANLYEVIDILSDELPDNAIIMSDAGQPTYAVPQALRSRSRHRYLAPGSLAEMGWALPAAIGAAAAAPGTTIVVIVGDGSLQTNLQELQTIRQYNLNVKLVVINNDGYASIRSTQDRFFAGTYIGSTRESGVVLPDIRRIADAYGITHVACQERSTIATSLRQLLASPGPAICEVAAMRDQEILPAVTSVRLPDGKMRSTPLHVMTDGRAKSAFSVPTLPHSLQAGVMANTVVATR